ncbi:MAG TPA: YfcE family phosphodiesterase [Candidatus Latescibacteria bacterium]|nr:YfcE family phosphodiesterase [Candidatus Latescibacterota bacterium]
MTDSKDALNDEGFRVGVLSDTHGRLNGAVFTLFEGADCIFHAGDIGKAQIIRELELIAPVHAIRGNTDPFDLPFPEVLDTSHKGIRFHVRHLVPTSGRSLEFFTMRMDADVVLFGHTHAPFVEEVRGTLFLNPGAISRSRVPTETAALITVRGGEVTATVHDLVPPEFPVRLRYPAAVGV